MRKGYGKMEAPMVFREFCLKAGLKLPKNLWGKVSQESDGKWYGICRWRNRDLELLPDRMILHRFNSPTVSGRQIVYLY